VSIELIQGSPEWHKARCGSLGASQIHLAIAKTRSGWGASRENIRAQLIAERLSGVPLDTYQNDAMRWGSEHEAEARSVYEAHTGLIVETVGLVKHPRLPFTHASPDGLIGDDGLIEIKCMQTASHIDVLLTEAIEQRYLYQMQWQMCCTGRQWCDFVAYDPRMPEHMRLFIKRIPRDDAQIAQLEKDVELFLREVATCYMALTAKYPEVAAA
jgi:putative phage-type endonuclease